MNPRIKRLLFWITAMLVSAVVLLFVYIRVIDWNEAKENTTQTHNIGVSEQTSASPSTSPSALKIPTSNPPTAGAKKLSQPFQVAVIYSDDYLIKLGGAERLHPFDIHKYKRFAMNWLPVNIFLQSKS